MSCIVAESLKSVTWPKIGAMHVDHEKLEKETVEWFKSFDAAKVEEFLKSRKGFSELAARVHPYAPYERLLMTSKFYLTLELLKEEVFKDISRKQELEDLIVIISKKMEIETYNGKNLLAALFSNIWVQICKLAGLDWQKHVIAMIEYFLRGAVLAVEKRKDGKCLTSRENDIMGPVLTWGDIQVLFVEFNMNHFHVELYRMNASYLLCLTFIRSILYFTMSLCLSRKLRNDKNKDVLNSVHWYEKGENLSYDEAVKKVTNDLDYKLKMANSIMTLYVPMLPVDFEWMLDGLRHVITGTCDFYRKHPYYGGNK
ncbi:hypothetical protein B4U80_13006 [Leptotrombidium deliense]|uniref:Uncharacterized protein n=1 Tax=Leptotrombidium deliense TaxID=299467 RepID=A0A443SF39_9ACAR|nr:hypothetical protein B4U80_13006 [Leptotrombidium deliense]